MDTAAQVAEDTSALIVLRHGEVFLKGANRRHFEQILENNVRGALSGLGSVQLERGQGRHFLRIPATHAVAALSRLGQVFGFSSVSPAVEIDPKPDSLVSEAESAARQLLAGHRPRSFRVTARRSDKRFPLTSPQINQRVGGALAESLGIPVDLHRPASAIGVEIGVVTSFVYLEQVNGAGGLPVGASGRVALLLSGGIDSPVAGHLAQKRGCCLSAIYFHSPPHTSPRALDKVERLAQRLARAQQSLSLHVVQFSEVQQRIRDRAPSELLVVLYRRAMMRIAQRIARATRCSAIVTGESVGQVASQTLQNLHAIADVVELPILRPLVTYDKQEAISLARKIGTYDVSIEPHLDCCSLFVPKHPATKVSPRRAQSAEANLELAPMLAAAAEQAEERRFEATW